MMFGAMYPPDKRWMIGRSAEDTAFVILAERWLQAHAGQYGAENVAVRDAVRQDVDVVHATPSNGWTTPWVDDKWDRDLTRYISSVRAWVRTRRTTPPYGLFNPAGAIPQGVVDAMCRVDPASCRSPADPPFGIPASGYQPGRRFVFRTTTEARAWIASQFPEYSITSWYVYPMFNDGTGRPYSPRGDFIPPPNSFLYSEHTMQIVDLFGKSHEVLLRIINPEPIV